MSVVNLKELLSGCCDAVDRGHAVIRQIHAQRLDGGSEALKAELKDEGCDRSWATIADMQAQAIIEAALRHDYPGIEIVGEEELPDDLTTGKTVAPLRRDHPACVNLTAPARHTTVPLSTVTVFIDPVDGTKEFVEGRVRNVCSLIGIAVRGEAVAGVIGLPFWKHDANGEGPLIEFDGRSSDVKSAMLCGIVDGTGGVGGLSAVDESKRQASLQSRNQGRTLRLAASGELTTQAGSPVSEARDALCTTTPKDVATGQWNSPFTVVPVPASGNKVVQVILGECDAALLNTKCSLWDTCAPEAVLRAVGGTCTDFFGAHFLHSAQNPMGTPNKLGGVASAKGVDHSRICKRLSATPGVTLLLKNTGLQPFGEIDDDDDDLSSTATSHVPIASDIARTIQGVPLTTEILSKAIGGAQPVVAFAAPDCSAVRYKMAECVRLCLRYQQHSGTSSSGLPPPTCGPKSVFVKRSVMRDLMHARAKITTAPHKLARDVRSYAVETAFLGSKACAELAASPSSRQDISNTAGNSAEATGVIRLAKALFSECHVEPESLIDSSFLVVLEDFTSRDGWSQKGFCNREELKATVWALARFHAYFWNGRVGKRSATTTATTDDSEIVQQLDKAVWDSGCYWSPKRQAPDQIEQLKERFEKHQYVKNFGPIVKDVATKDGTSDALVGLDKLMERLQKEVPACARASHLYLSHGDGDKDASSSFTNAPGVGKDATTGAETQSDRSRNHPQRTLIHGDLKAANLFFRPKCGNSAVDGAAEVDAGFIDFQWTGWGLGAVDLAYLMCAAAGPGTLDLREDAEGETLLLEHYHTSLCLALAEFGVVAKPEDAHDLQSFALLQRQYEDALLDHSVTVFSYLWNDIKANPEVLRERGIKFALTANAVNKSPECAAWLLGRCAMILQRREKVKNC